MLLLCIIIAISVAYAISAKIPMQVLKITATTKTEQPDISGVTDLYHFGPLEPGSAYTAEIRFMAVKGTSQGLFTDHGTGQYVYLGCDELHAQYSFISIGRYLHVKLTLSAAQTDLKLEDGTPFDATRYSLKPVLTIKR